MTFFYLKKAEELGELERLAGSSVLGVDLETAGKNGLIPQQSRIRLIQLATETDSFVIDLDQVDPMPILHPLLTSPEVPKIFHHAKFDVKHLLYHFSLETTNIFCTMLASQLLAKGQSVGRHGLADVARRFLGKQVDKSMQHTDWSGALSEAQIQYAATDAEVLVDLHKVMVKRIREAKLNKVSQLEFRTVVPVAAMELKGVYVDQERLALEREKLIEECRELEDEVLQDLRMGDALPGMNMLNLNAPEQVKKALHEKGIKVPDTADSRLRPLAEKYPFIEKLLDYRHKTKIISSAIRPLVETRIPETGRVHPSYHQIASASGRFACSDPNIQQVPREKSIRSCVCAEPGYLYIIADYSQVELRVAAGLSRDPIMLQAYSEGKDLHRLTAALTMNKPIEEVTNQERQAAKAINFGLIYAMGAKGLQQSARASYGVTMTPGQAATFRNRYFQNYKGIQVWQRELERRGKERQFVRTAGGRLRSYLGESIRITELFNTPVQGTAAEGLKSALCIFWDRAKEHELDATIIAIIHDEIIVEVKEDQAEKAKTVLEKAMIDGISWLVPGVPFEVEAFIGPNWSSK